MPRSFVLVVFIWMLAAPEDGHAQHRVTAKRVASNLYTIIEGRLLVRTSACTSLALLDEAILTQTNIRFVADKEDCLVRAVYKEINLKPGAYKVTVTHLEWDFFQLAPDFYARTYACLSLTVGGVGTLTWNGAGGFLKAGISDCMTEALYQTYQLP
jgi:hypothetical protein